MWRRASPFHTPLPAVPAAMSSLRDSSSPQQQSFDLKVHQERSNTPPKLAGRFAERSSGLDTSSTAMGDQAISSYLGKIHAPDRTPLQTGCFLQHLHARDSSVQWTAPGVVGTPGSSSSADQQA